MCPVQIDTVDSKLTVQQHYCIQLLCSLIKTDFGFVFCFFFFPKMNNMKLGQIILDSLSGFPNTSFFFFLNLQKCELFLELKVEHRI